MGAQHNKTVKVKMGNCLMAGIHLYSYFDDIKGNFPEVKEGDSVHDADFGVYAYTGGKFHPIESKEGKYFIIKAK